MGDGTNSFQIGDLKHRLPTLRLLRFDGASLTQLSGDFLCRVHFQGLNDSLKYFLGVCIVADDGSPFRPASGIDGEGDDYPASPGEIQIFPMSNFSDIVSKGYFRPVFQDPTKTTNVNDPQGQDIPFSWNSPAETDELELVVTVPYSSYNDSGITGTLIAQAMVEYTGDWWDIAAIKYAFGQVKFSGAPETVPVHGTGAIG